VCTERRAVEAPVLIESSRFVYLSTNCHTVDSLLLSATMVEKCRITCRVRIVYIASIERMGMYDYVLAAAAKGTVITVAFLARLNCIV